VAGKLLSSNKLEKQGLIKVTLADLYFFLFVSDVWGFDEKAVSVLRNMRPADESLIHKYAILLGEKAFNRRTDEEVSDHLS
jgi:hypothetical protein